MCSNLMAAITVELTDNSKFEVGGTIEVDIDTMKDMGSGIKTSC